MMRFASALISATAVLLLLTPVAGADDPNDCDQLPPDQVQQCQQQKAAGIANQAIDQAKDGADKAKRAADQGQKAIDLSDKNCWLVNGVPTMWSPALVSGPGQTAVPCYSAYGLTPH